MRELFKVVFRGQQTGEFEGTQLKQNLLQLGFGSKQVETLLAGRSVTIKSGLTAALAERYRQRLHDAGLVTEILPDGSAVKATTPQPSPASPGQQAEDNGGEPASGGIDTTHPAPPSPAPERRLSQLQFTGTGSEYFGIWIVNILLLVVTFGFYAPWAKVRNLQYFYGHTVLEAGSFQYLADPWVIFRGRLVALVAVIIWSVASSFFPLVASVLVLLFLPLIPWIITRSLKFHAINSAYRNIRFDFAGSYWQAFQVVYLWPLVGILSLGLLLPLAAQRWYSFLVNNTRFGTSAFQLSLTVGQVYLFFLRMILVFVGFALLGGLASMLHSALGMIGVVLAYLALFGYMMAGVTNLVTNATRLDQHGFVSTLGKRRMVWIFVTNSILIALTMGFYTAWAKVRMARYRASCTQMEIAGDLDGFVAGEAQRAGAVGMELGDAFDVGFSFG
ncbi:YjgN family protein [Halopseudomonas oceani]|uniref:YjgN family protein n=1 Tax=Halopseudomonas oceani TaxID=1708783 RepID=UPI002AA8C486|nr:YjgN family protein [Halopseudomonas oceani]